MGTRSFGGDKRDRTADLLHAMQALSQLSYTPKKRAHYNELPYACKATSVATAFLCRKIHTNLSSTKQLLQFFDVTAISICYKYLTITTQNTYR